MPKIKRAGLGYVRTVTTVKSGTKFQPCYKRHGKLHTGGTFPTEQQAWDWLRDEESAIRTSTLHDPTGAKRMFRTVGDDWLKSNPDKSGSTLNRDAKILANDIYPTFGNRAVGSISQGDVQALVTSWTNEKYRGKKLAAGTVWRKFRVLSAVLAFAQDRGWIPTNPAVANTRSRRSGANLPKQVAEVSAQDRYPLTAEDVERIEAALGEHMALFVRIGAAAGLRRNQILGLQVRDFDSANGFLHSDKGVTVGRDEEGKLVPTIGNPGSTKAPDLTVSIDPVTVEKIGKHIAAQGIAHNPTAYLFATRDGQLLDPSNVQKAWKAAVKKAGFGDVKPAIGTHDLRRFSARLMHENGVPLAVIKARFGHSDIRVTEKYISVSAEADRRASDALAVALAG